MLTTVMPFSLSLVYPFPCEVDPVVFEVPQGYTMLGAGRTEPMRDEDDDLLQFAIQQSLLDAGTETDQVIGLACVARGFQGPFRIANRFFYLGHVLARVVLVQGTRLTLVCVT